MSHTSRNDFPEAASQSDTGSASPAATLLPGGGAVFQNDDLDPCAHRKGQARQRQRSFFCQRGFEAMRVHVYRYRGP